MAGKKTLVSRPREREVKIKHIFRRLFTLSLSIGCPKKRKETLMAGKENQVTRPIESEDIIKEIFLRLPRKSLARFKSVSKQWLGIISSASFIQDYDTKNLPTLYSFCMKVRHTAHPIKLSLSSLDNTSSVVEFHNFPRARRFTSIVDSSNGLILYHTTDKDPFKQDEEKLKSFYFLRNPVTDQYFPIPVQPTGLRHLARRGPGDAMGFAFDHSTNPPHMIITEVLRMRKNVLRVISYSSYTRRWAFKDHELPFPYHLDTKKTKDYFKLFGPSTFLNGKLHWVSYWSRIFAYDVKEASFSIMEGPVDGHIFIKRTTPRGVYLGQSRERLIYIQFSFADVLDRIASLWTLENYGNSKWTPGYKIRMNNMPAHPTNNFWPVLATDWMDNKVLYISLGNKLYSYHVDKELFYCHTPDAPDDRYFHILQMLYLLELPRSPLPILYNLYELPKSPPFIPPQLYFSALFGDVPLMGWHDFNNMLQSAAMLDSPPRQS